MVDWVNLGRTNIEPPDLRKLAKAVPTFKQPEKPKPLPVPEITTVNVDWLRLVEDLREKYALTHVSLAAGMGETYLNNAKRHHKFDPPYSVGSFLLDLHRETFSKERHGKVYL